MQLQNILKKIALALITLVVVGCNGQSTSAALEAYKKQEHRFEVRACEFFYNEKRVELYKPKSYYENIWGTNYKDYGTTNFYYDKPFVFKDEIRSLKQKNIRDVVQLSIKFWQANPEKKNYNRYKDFPYMKKGQYILIDGIPFGHGVSMKSLNRQLRNKGLQAFTEKFAGSSGIKAKGYSTCENFPQFFIHFSKDGELENVKYEIDKPKHLN